MRLPNDLLTYKLADGLTLVDRVRNDEPALVEIKNKNAFLMTWESRMNDDIAAGDHPSIERSRRVVEFVKSTNSELHLIMWPSHKIAVLARDEEDEFLILNE